MSLTLDHIKKLSAPFDEKTLGIKVQSLSKDRTKAMLVCYLQHTDVYVRLESVDPAWASEILSVDWVQDACFTRMRLTVQGTSRENVGEGGDPKSAASDAIKRCAMLFGVGRYLYDSETVWVPYNEQQDRFRVYSLQDYRGALKRGQSPVPTADTPGPAGPIAKPAFGAPAKMNRAQMGAEVYRIAGVIQCSDQELTEWVFELFKKTPERLTDAELEQFLKTLQEELGRMGA